MTYCVSELSFRALWPSVQYFGVCSKWSSESGIGDGAPPPLSAIMNGRIFCPATPVGPVAGRITLRAEDFGLATCDPRFCPLTRAQRRRYRAATPKSTRQRVLKTRESLVSHLQVTTYFRTGPSFRLIILNTYTSIALRWPRDGTALLAAPLRADEGDWGRTTMNRY